MSLKLGQPTVNFLRGDIGLYIAHVLQSKIPILSSYTHGSCLKPDSKSGLYNHNRLNITSMTRYVELRSLAMRCIIALLERTNQCRT
jgi:hypothetical protein